MHQLSIEICNNRNEANARKDIVKASNPNANWVTRIVEDIGFVLPFLVPTIANDPESLPPVFTPAISPPTSPAVILLIWTESS